MLARLPLTGLFLKTQPDSRPGQDQSSEHQLTETGSSLLQGLVLYFDLPVIPTTSAHDYLHFTQFFFPEPTKAHVPWMWSQHFSIIPPENCPGNIWVSPLSWEQSLSGHTYWQTLSPLTGAFVEFMFHSVPQRLFEEPLVAWMEQPWLVSWETAQPESPKWLMWKMCIVSNLFKVLSLKGKKNKEIVYLLRKQINHHLRLGKKMNNLTTLNWF